MWADVPVGYLGWVYVWADVYRDIWGGMYVVCLVFQKNSLFPCQATRGILSSLAVCAKLHELGLCPSVGITTGMNLTKIFFSFTER